MNTQAVEQNKPATSLETKMTTLKLSYFRHIMRRQSYLEKTIAGENRRQREKRKTKYEMN